MRLQVTARARRTTDFRRTFHTTTSSTTIRCHSNSSSSSSSWAGSRYAICSSHSMSERRPPDPQHTSTHGITMIQQVLHTSALLKKNFCAVKSRLKFSWVFFQLQFSMTISSVSFVWCESFVELKSAYVTFIETFKTVVSKKISQTFRAKLWTVSSSFAHALKHSELDDV